MNGIVTLPATTISIGDLSFESCQKIAKIKIKAVAPPSLYANSFQGMQNLTNILVPTNSVNIYKTAPIWISYSNKISSI